MKTMMKIFSLLLCLSMVLGVFASCASKTPDEETEAPKAEEKKKEKEEKQEEEPKGLKYTLLSDGTYEVSVGTESDAETIEIPALYQTKKVTSIAESAFYGCAKLKNIVIPNTVTSIGNGAFEECTSLRSITLPASVAKIGVGVFGYCSALTEIKVASQNQKYESIDGDLYHKETYTLVQYAPGKTATSFEFPDGISRIGGGAFLGCEKLTSITLPEDVVAMGEGAFRGCGALKSISIPDGIVTIGADTFRDCIALTSITLPNTLLKIGDSAFKGCKALTEISIPDGVATVEDAAFENCTNLTNIDLPDSVTKIGYDAFYLTKYYDTESNWEKIYYDEANEWGIKVLYLGNHLIKAETCAPEYDPNEKYPEFPNVASTYSVKAGTKTVADGAFYSCLFPTSLILPDGVTSIGMSAFNHCTRLSEITIPKSVTSIGDFAFSGCRNITTATMPTIAINYIQKGNLQTVVINGGESIGDRAFDGCSNLTSVTIPKSVTEIGDFAFELCTALTYIYFEGTQAEWQAIQKDTARLPDSAELHFIEPID